MSLGYLCLRVCLYPADFTTDPLIVGDCSRGFISWGAPGRARKMYWMGIKGVGSPGKKPTFVRAPASFFSHNVNGGQRQVGGEANQK